MDKPSFPRPRVAVLGGSGIRTAALVAALATNLRSEVVGVRWDNPNADVLGDLEKIKAEILPMNFSPTEQRIQCFYDDLNHCDLEQQKHYIVTPRGHGKQRSFMNGKHRGGKK